MSIVEKAVIALNGELPDHKNEHYAIAGNVIHRPFFPRGENLVCTIDEFNAAADLMRCKPDWSELPPETEWLGQDRCGKWKPMVGPKPTTERGYWMTSHHLMPQPRGMVIGDWRKTLEKRPEQKPLESDRFGIMPPVNKNECCSIPSPANHWFEAGELPPVWTVCEYAIDGGHWWHCEIRYIVCDEGVVMWAPHLEKEQYCSAHKVKFRPVNPDRQQLIDIIESVGNQSNGVLANAILAAGWGWLGK